jgi:hypothetical protein
VVTVGSGVWVRVRVKVKVPNQCNDYRLMLLLG